ncbi:hypothetical protein GLOIN_2v1477641 [Rhizophagus clarus]|uniref:SAM domain-containing protein n=1 Tax=Rhizophagus clarus TaxID=94130 RepID=A0A8H3L1T9_9GLOM|nr:hypothetical protein GLOIN_2v1477641 [Rhizophagus clarus]
MLNGLATVKEPPTHPLLHIHIHQKIDLNPLVALQFFQQSPLQSLSSQQSLPLMAEFLQQIDKAEGMENYYSKFLERFKTQRIRVKHLNKLSDMQFETCGVTAIGDIETIREAA